MTSVNAKTLIDLLKRHFFSRTDRAAVKYNGIITPIVLPAESDLDAVLLTHVLGDQAPEAVINYITKKTRGVAKGRYRVGSYTPAPDDTTAWLCIDVDGPGHANSVADPNAAARVVAAKFTEYGIQSYVERSGGGKGWHVWVFFEQGVPAALARELAAALIPRDIPLAAGGFANAVKGQGVEIFPKQDSIRKGGYGNLLWLPWWAGARDGACQFHTFDDDGAPVRCMPEVFSTASLDAVNAAIQRLEAAELAALYETVPTPDNAEAFSGEWKKWRKEALAALPLDTIYGEWLTGNTTGDGWLECRDPESPSGDKNPSAGVADTTSQAQRGSFHSFISNTTLSVFDFMIARGMAIDFRHAVRRVAELSGKTNVFRKAAAALASQSVGDAPAALPRRARPAIQVNNRQLDRMVEETWRAVFKANANPVVFTRHDSLVELRFRADGPCIEDMSRDALFEYLGRVADWVVVTQEATFDTVPSRDVVRATGARPHKDLPALDCVLTAPVYGRAGALINTRGYHPEDRAWYEPDRGLDVPNAPAKPTAEDVAAARALLLDDLVADFPFISPSDQAHWLAALILPFVRRMIPGPTPLHFVEAPCNGAGKSLLCDLISLVATGRSVNAQTLPQNDDESAKVITAELLHGRPLILLDNQSEKNKLCSTALASVLTAEYWSGRLLGQSKMLTLSNTAVWMMTGNNPNMTTEMARRCIRVRVDPKRDRAWQRDPEEFRHPDLKEWTLENRNSLIQAIHTLVNAWIAAGQPRGRKTIGSYEKWSRVIGGILQTAGVPGFLECQDEMYVQADTDAEEWNAFVLAWWDEFAEHPVRVCELNMMCERDNLLSAVRGDKGSRSQEIKLGRSLNAMRDRVFGDKRITVVDGAKYSKGGKMYALVCEDGNDGDPEGGPGERSDDLLSAVEPDADASVGLAPDPQCGCGADNGRMSKSQHPHIGSLTNSNTSENSADVCGYNSQSRTPACARVIDNITITRARRREADGHTSAHIRTDDGPGGLSRNRTTPSTSADVEPIPHPQRPNLGSTAGAPPPPDRKGAGQPAGAGGNGAGGNGTNGRVAHTGAGAAAAAKGKPPVPWVPNEPPPGAGEAWEDPDYTAPTMPDGSKVLDPWDPGYDPANDPYCNAGDDEDGLS